MDGERRTMLGGLSAMVMLISAATWAAAAATTCDVSKYGAKADGKTDDWAAIQKAIDEVSASGGGVVLLRASAQPYVVSRTISITSDDIELSGYGATIKLADGAADGTRDATGTQWQMHVIYVTGKEGRRVRHISIKGLTIDANIYEQRDYYNPRAIVCEHAERVRVKDVRIIRPFVGLAFGFDCSDCEARDCVIEDWAEDGFDASGDANHHPGGVTTDVLFINCHARNAPRAGGNAWEIEDGAQGVLVQDCSVENVAGNGFGVRNHWDGEDDITKDIELCRVTVRNVTGKYGIYSHCAPTDTHPTNHLSHLRLSNVVTDAPVLFYGPTEGLHIDGGSYKTIYLGWEYGSKQDRQPGGPEYPLKEARVENATAQHIKINGASGDIVVSNVAVIASRAEGGVGIRVIGGSGNVQVVGCTITRARKAGVMLQKASPEILNSIVWRNLQGFALDDVSKPSIAHCCLQGGVPRGAADGGGNLSANPMFAPGPGGRYYLRQSVTGRKGLSPCVDAGRGRANERGMDRFTTRRDHNPDAGAVDIGYHYPLQLDS